MFNSRVNVWKTLIGFKQEIHKNYNKIVDSNNIFFIQINTKQRDRSTIIELNREARTGALQLRFSNVSP